MGIGTGLASAYGKARTLAHQADLEAEQRAQAEEERKQQALQRQVQMAALEAGLRAQGVMPEGEAQDTSLTFGVPMGLPGVQSSVTIPKGERYKPLGQTGRVLDTMNTPQAQQRVQQALEQRRREQEAEAQRRQALLLERERQKAAEAARLQAYVLARQGHQADRTFDNAHPAPQREKDPAKDASKDPMATLTPSQANEVKKKQEALINLRRSLGALRGLVQQNGAEVMPGKTKASMAAAVSDARLQLKEAAALGALTGPDMEILSSMIADPTSMFQLPWSQGARAIAGYDQIDATLDRRAKALEEVYGVQMPASFYGKAAPAPADAKGQEVIVNGKRYTGGR